VTATGEPEGARPAWQVELVDGALTRELRRAVLRPQLTAAAALPGDDLPAAIHVAALTPDGTPASTCFVYADGCPFLQGVPGAAWHLRQMATDPRWRGQGAGAAVIGGVLSVLRERDAGLLWCHARETAGGFYQSQGFHTVGEVFTDERHPIPHLRMWRPV
jgi:GNAT superfamily N-acetyltransferase